MKSKLQRAIRWVRANTFDKKVSMLIVVSILLTSSILLVITTVTTVNTLMDNSRKLATQQVESLSRNMESSLADYKDLIMILMLDDQIQDYLKAETTFGTEFTTLANAATKTIAYIRSAKSSITYIMVARGDNPSHYLYNGLYMAANSSEAPLMPDSYMEVTQKSAGTLRYRMQQLSDGQWNLQLFQPIYDKYRLGRQLGMLCIGIDEKELGQFSSTGSGEMALHTHITDGAGRVLYDAEPEYIGTQEAFAAQLTRPSGDFAHGDSMIIYRSVSQWNMCIIGSISLSDMLADSYQQAFLLILLVALLTIASLVVSMRFIYHSCAPLRDAVQKMQVVSRGDLTARMDESIIGTDFREISENFNSMVVRLEELMERVKLEERRNQQTRFNMLQSQIQPHFLYNTLECVHWQAAASGDKEVSEMVTALASYYRLCLSQGQDVIPLWQELQLVNRYLTIQNMRYDNIIDIEYHIPEELFAVMLPKMTLQPLVENSIYHGVKDQGGTHGHIRLEGRVEDGEVILVFSDNGAGMSPEEVRRMNETLARQEPNSGYGVRNVHNRIAILFGQGYGLHYDGNQEGGITVTIRFPATRPEDLKGDTSCTAF